MQSSERQGCCPSTRGLRRKNLKVGGMSVLRPAAGLPFGHGNDKKESNHAVAFESHALEHLEVEHLGLQLNRSSPTLDGERQSRIDSARRFRRTSEPPGFSLPVALPADSAARFLASPCSESNGGGSAPVPRGQFRAPGLQESPPTH
jgi:hypothetical protein